MTDQPATAQWTAPAGDGAVDPAASAAASAPWQAGGGAVTAAMEDRPELAVGAAFAGGFLLALIFKRLAS